MTVTAHINIDTPAGSRFVREMAKFPKVWFFTNYWYICTKKVM